MRLPPPMGSYSLVFSALGLGQMVKLDNRLHNIKVFFSHLSLPLSAPLSIPRQTTKSK
jgi:hypothetical protein